MSNADGSTQANQLACDVCGGALVMDASRASSRCDRCGLNYSVEAMRSMLEGVATTTIVLASSTPQSAPAHVTATSLLKRARLLCEDGYVTRAEKLVDEALNLNPENGEAYLLALIAGNECRTESDLGSIPTGTLHSSLNFEKAKRFGDADLRARLDDHAARARTLATAEGIADYLRLVRWNGNRPLTELELRQFHKVARIHAERVSREAEAARETARVAERDAQLRARAERIISWRDEDADDQTLRWKVVHIHPTEEQALVLSERCVTTMAYGVANADGFSTWADSKPRMWLNAAFLESLSSQLRSRIIEVDHRLQYVKDPARVRYDSIPNPDATPVLDCVFLLDEAELQHLPVSVYNQAGRQASLTTGVKVGWWLRSDSHPHWYRRERPLAIGEDGRMIRRDVSRPRDDTAKWEYGAESGKSLGLRPALWLDVSEE